MMCRMEWKRHLLSWQISKLDVIPDERHTQSIITIQQTVSELDSLWMRARARV